MHVERGVVRLAPRVRIATTVLVLALMIVVCSPFGGSQGEPLLISTASDRSKIYRQNSGRLIVDIALNHDGSLAALSKRSRYSQDLKPAPGLVIVIDTITGKVVDRFTSATYLLGATTFMGRTQKVVIAGVCMEPFCTEPDQRAILLSAQVGSGSALPQMDQRLGPDSEGKVADDLIRYTRQTGRFYPTPSPDGQSIFFLEAGAAEDVGRSPHLKEIMVRSGRVGDVSVDARPFFHFDGIASMAPAGRNRIAVVGRLLPAGSSQHSVAASHPGEIVYFKLNADRTFSVESTSLPKEFDVRKWSGVRLAGSFNSDTLYFVYQDIIYTTSGGWPVFFYSGTDFNNPEYEGRVNSASFLKSWAMSGDGKRVLTLRYQDGFDRWLQSLAMLDLESGEIRFIDLSEAMSE